jgi:Ser/Thr protein kinase RdoA (MazF antagonist)
LDALAHLAGKGIAVAPALPRRNGEPIGVLRAPEGPRYAVLFAYADGVKPVPPFTATLYFHFGQATARLHGSLDDFTSLHARVPLDLAYLLDRPLAALRPWLAHRPDDWAFLVYLAEKVRAHVTALATAGLDWGVCHGDLSLDNVHVTPDHRVIFYDFDSGGPGWRASDSYGVFQYQPRDNWDAFLSGYGAVRAFAPTEVAAVPHFAAANGIRQMANRVRNLAAWHGRWLVTDAYFDDQLARWRRWDAEHLSDM